MINLSKIFQNSVARKTLCNSNMRRLNRIIMSTGEGAAISQAGTSKVRAVLKSGSRVIKNSL